MKIGMILDDTFPPDPRVENEAITLINEGHEVFLFCLSYSNDVSEENINGIKVKRYVATRFDYKLSALAYTFPFYSITMSKKIKDFIKRNRIEKLHIHDMRIAEAVFIANRSFKLSVVLDLHENRPEIMNYYPHLHKFPGKYLISTDRWKQKEEEFIKKADRVIVVTQQAANEIVDRVEVKKEKIVVVPNSVRKSFYEESEIDEAITNKYKDDFVVLYLGDTNLRRGLLTAIESSAKLSQEIENYKLVIVGSNTTDIILKDRSRELGLENYIDFEGWQELSLFPAYISSSSICISPLHRNLHHDTTYANKLFQYMSYGKPLLVSDAIAQKEIIQESKAGLVHLEKDVKDFTMKILDLYRDSKKSKTLGDNGKRFVEEKFSWEITSKSLVKLYEEI